MTPGFFKNAPQFMLVAHRGGLLLGPENTLAAARLGHAAGAHGWELDVGFSSDWVLMVMHDSKLKRSTNAAQLFPGRRPWRLGEFSQEELSRLDAGFWFQDQNKERPFQGEPIPTLAQALEFSKERNWPVNVEIKDLKGRPGHGRIAAAVVRAIQEAEMTELTLVSSFQHAYLAQVKNLKPGLALGVLVKRLPSDPAGLLSDLGAHSLHAPWRPRDLARYRKICGAGIRLLPYVANSRSEAEKLRQAGAQGLFSDNPGLLAQAGR